MKKKINNILITNDDGYDAIGIKVLVEIAEKLGENIYVVSPKNNQSAKSKSITIRNKINFEKISNYNWIIDGTPTDCMIFALNHIFKSNKPDLILSGINAGSNVGDEVSYSGTVAAAWEGAVRGINSIALSQLGGDHKSNSYSCSMNYSVEIIKNLLKIKTKPPLYFNVNFPLNISESNNSNVLYTKLASQKKSDEIFVHNSESSYKIGRMLNSYQTTQETDMDALKKNKISLTPLTLDLTNISLFNQLNKR